jgi:fimbrial chaperone protein
LSAVLLCALAALAVAPADAANLAVSPIRIELTPENRTAAITVTNGSDQPASIQIEAVAWSQVDGQNVYAPTRELLVSPPIFTLAPGSEQIVRAALRRQADPTTELAYRIYLQELPPPPSPGFRGVQMALRLGLPVFVQPQSGKAVPKPNWSAKQVSDDTLQVTLRNEGNAHVQVSDFALYSPGNDQALGSQAGSTYVLPGQAHRWLVKVKRPFGSIGGRLRLAAHTDAGEANVDLPLESP